MLRSFVLATVLALGSVSAAHAQEILTFERLSGWIPGDAAGVQYGEGLVVNFSVDSSPNTGRMYVRARFCNTTSFEWVGGIRVTTNYPDSTHATVRVPPSDCSPWSEHLQYGATAIYVLIDKRD